MALTPYMRKNVLDFLCGGAAPVRPAQLWISWANGIPNDNGASDGSVNSRVMLVSGAFQGMAPANSPQGSVTNRSAGSSNATATVVQTVTGWNLWDSAVGGTRLAYGTLTASIVASTGSGIALSAGRLNISIS